MQQSLLGGIEPAHVGTLLERLLAIADDAVVVVDARFDIVIFNDGAVRMFGYPAGDVRGRPLSMLIPQPLRSAHARHLAAFAGSADPARRMAQRSDIQGQRADGSLFYAEASIAKVELDGASYFAAIVRDISATRMATVSLQRSEARFRELAASAPVGIFQADAQGRYTFVNERWCQMAGIAAPLATGCGWLQAVHPADRNMVHAAWQDHVRKSRPFDIEYRFLWAEPQEVWVVARAVESRDADGTTSGFIGTVTDVTASRKQARALEHAMSQAEAAARAKGMFLANVSHEIRTPLNAVIGMTSLLLDTAMSDEQQDYARTIRSSSQALLDVINDILDFSKAENGDFEIEHHAFDLRACIEEALDLVASRAAQKHLNLAYMVEDGTPESLVGDGKRLRQILVNLLSNAVKFTQNGEVLVTVDSEALTQDTHCVHFAVQDTGIGIAAADLPRLFQSFSQVDASTTRKYGGSGLGLAISRRLAELMDGTVTVESEVGRGSTFHLRIQVRAGPASDANVFLRPDAPGLAGRRVLVVDDNLTNRRLLTRLALLWGMAPSTFPSGLEALDRIRHGEHYDLAIIDMQMPGTDGLDLAGAMHQLAGTATLPIVMLTSLGQRAVPGDPRGEHLAATVSKPIKAAQLFAVLTQVLGGAADGELAAPRQPAVQDGAKASAPRAPLKILVAEDNAVNQRVVSLLLHRLGYGADLATNGLEVIEAVERTAYDVVLMDIHMPEMDGLQAARWIGLHRGGTGRPRIIAMTANAFAGDRERIFSAGIDAFIAKPVEAKTLAAVIQQVSGMDRGKPAPDPHPEPVLDRSRLTHLVAMQVDDRSELVPELIDMFVSDSQRHLDAMADAVQHGDARLLGDLAHRYLSVTQNLGATRLSRMCVDIERLTRSGQLEPAARIVDALGLERDLAQAAMLTLRPLYCRPAP